MGIDGNSVTSQPAELKVMPKQEPEDSTTIVDEGSQQHQNPLQQYQLLRNEQDNGCSVKSTSIAGTCGSGDDQECEQSYKDDQDTSSRKNTDGTSGDDHESEHGSKRRRRHRHTPEQIRELESVFQRCSLPDKKLRQELSDSLGLNEQQVKFWFQNRRIQMKAIQERSDNAQLRAEIERMKAENVTIREAIKQHTPSSGTSTEPVLVQNKLVDELQRRQVDNTSLRDEAEHVMPIRALPMYPSVPLMLTTPSHDALSLELAVGRHPPLTGAQPQQLQGAQVILDMRRYIDAGSGSLQGTDIHNILNDKLRKSAGIDDQKQGRKLDFENGFGKTSEGASRDDQEDHGSQDDHENASAKNMEETGSGEDHEYEESSKKKRYQRHTAEQIHQLELFFKHCAHPDQRQRDQLSTMLGLNPRQIKFWFQNRRNQMKNLQERYDNTQLRAEIERLRAENISIREAVKQHLVSCNDSSSVQQETIDEKKRCADSARLREEVDHMTAASVARPTPALSSPPMAIPLSSDPLSLELAVGRRPTLPEPVANTKGEGNQPRQPQQSSPTLLEVALSWPGGISGAEKAAVMDLAESAIQEMLEMVQADEPLWVRRGLGDQAVYMLDMDSYAKRFTNKSSIQMPGLITEASRENGVVSINNMALLDALMDANKWVVMFPSIVAKALTVKVLSPGIGSSVDGALQLMYAELQVLSPVLQTREVYFLRYCKQVSEKMWVVVDVSMDCLRDNPPPCLLQCRRRPSGCIVQEVANGHSQVTWLEHMEVEHPALNHIYLPFLSSGSAFGAKRWVCALQHYCEDMGSLLATNMGSTRDLGAVNTLEGRRSTLRLAKKMINRYYSNVSTSSSRSWIELPCKSGSKLDDVRIMAQDNAGDGIILCAATSAWLPFSHKRVFDFLRSEEYRSQRNVLANGSAQEMSRITKGQNLGNNVSLLRVNGPSQSNILILQETWTDESGSLLVYMPVDFSTISRVLQGEDPSDFLLLPSGFAILPDGPLENHSTAPNTNADGANSVGVGNNTSATKISLNASGNSLLTVSFQTVVGHVPSSSSSGKLGAPSANPVSSILFNTMESMNTVSQIIRNTLQHIKIALETSKA